MYREDTHLDQIIRTWYQKAMEQDDQGNYVENPITRFVFLWFSFNAYYSSTLIELIKENERNHVYNEDGTVKIPSEIVAIVKSMNPYSKQMKEWINLPGFEYFCNRSIIKDMYPGRQGDSYGYGNGPKSKKTGYVIGGDIYSNNKKAQLQGFLNILYSVRCNLFHGQKRCYSDDDLEIIENACLCLSNIIQVIFA